MSHQHNIKDIGYLSPSDRKAIIFLVLLIIILLLTTYILTTISNNKSIDKERIAQLIQEQQSKIAAEKAGPYMEQNKVERNITSEKKTQITKSKPFLDKIIDPNTATQDELQSLGLTAFASKNLISYRNSGARFYQLSDLFKIYGIDSLALKLNSHYLEFPQLPTQKFEPAIASNIPPTENPAQNVNMPKTTAPSERIILDLNKVDSSALVSIRGIGPSYASRIIRLRNQLGGYYKVEQLREVWNLPIETYNEIKDHFTVDMQDVKKINLVTVEFKDLLRHPYTDYNMTKLLKNIHPLRVKATVDSLHQAGTVPDSLYVYLQD